MKRVQVTRVIVGIIVIFLFLAIITIGIIGLYITVQNEFIVKEFCNDKGYDYEGDGESCYRMDNNHLIWKTVSVIDGKAYFREQGGNN